jgi:hypothetical protein
MVFIDIAIANKAFKDSHKMDLGALAWVERTNKIIETEVVFTGGWCCCFLDQTQNSLMG